MLKHGLAALALAGPAAAGCYDYTQNPVQPRGELCLGGGICLELALEAICSNQSASFAVYSNGWRVDFDMTSDGPGVVSLNGDPLGPWDLADMTCTDLPDPDALPGEGAATACEFMATAISQGAADY